MVTSGVVLATSGLGVLSCYGYWWSSTETRKYTNWTTEMRKWRFVACNIVQLLYCFKPHHLTLAACYQ